MTGFENSAARQAAQIRARARKDLWRRLTALLGLNPAARRADAQAALWAHGARGEAATVALLEQLRTYGWHVRHDLRLPRSRANLDHVLASPCGRAVVVLDTKTWHRGRPTRLEAGRVYCGLEDRHAQVEKVAAYAARVRQELGLPEVVVWPLLVVHGSPIAGGQLEARVAGWEGPVWVLGPELLVPTLVRAPRVRDARRSAVLAGRVDAVLRPYGEGG